ncbi:MAG: hypothetical protein WAQ52_13695 [Terriglobales bacterium]
MSSEKSKITEDFWRVISKLEAKRKSRIFCLIHCPDDGGHICKNTTLWQTLSERDNFKNIDTLELLLHSPGGSADAAYQVTRFFRRHCKRLNIIVPLEAKSAATLMCLGADAIYMGELAELGPIDVQIQDPIEKGAKSISPLDEFKSAEFLRDYAVEIMDSFTLLIIRRSGISVKEALHESLHFTTEIMRPLYEQLDPLEIGEFKRALAIGEEYGDRLLAMTKNPHRKTISQALLSKYPSHDFVIDRTEARSLGLPVHALDAAQEGAFLDALTSMLTSGESLYGFNKVSARKPAAKPARKKQATTPAPPKILAAAG